MITILFTFLFISGTTQTSSDTLVERFPTPVGFERITTNSNSFTAYLRAIPLKKKGSLVTLYNGDTKNYQDGAAAVLDIDVGSRDLQQCADAVIRLRAEYLYGQQKFAAIHFNLTNGFRMDYEKWANGNRVKVSGNKTWWEHTADTSFSYSTFRKYLNFVFAYAGTLSLSKELKPQSINEITPGNVFIEGGSPGHAVIVMDVAKHSKTGEKIFLLAQSYMPAQDIHILKNLNNASLSPWYSAKDLSTLHTPEWTFEVKDLCQF